MAIKLNVELENGIKVDGAYLRIEVLYVCKDSLSFAVRKYTDADKPFFASEMFEAPYNIEGENPFNQAYEYLKTLYKFKDAEDC